MSQPPPEAFDDVLVAVTEPLGTGAMGAVAQLMQLVSTEARPLLLVTDELAPPLDATLGINAIRGLIEVLAVRVSAADRDALAALAGTTIMSAADAKSCGLEALGRVGRVELSDGILRVFDQPAALTAPMPLHEGPGYLELARGGQPPALDDDDARSCWELAVKLARLADQVGADVRGGGVELDPPMTVDELPHSRRGLERSSLPQCGTSSRGSRRASSPDTSASWWRAT